MYFNYNSSDFFHTQYLSKLVLKDLSHNNNAIYLKLLKYSLKNLYWYDFKNIIFHNIYLKICVV